MKRIAVYSLVSLAALLFACKTTDGSVPTPSPTSPVVHGFQVSKERYETSLKEIRDLTNRLNSIIQGERFQDWKDYLDSSYRKTFSDPAKLKEISLSPVFKQNSIALKDLYDYFQFVVVPSRSNAQVDDITFLDEERVEAWMIIKNQRALLYQLKLYGKEWKISSW